MKIELQEPFKTRWVNGYLRISNEGRRIVDLVKSSTDRTTISYARYLMSVKLGYLVPDEFEVDHIDDDFTNDDINNLQLLTPEQNKLKQNYLYITQRQVTYGFCCAYCQARFILTQNELNCRLKQGRTYAFCSKPCSSTFMNLMRRYSN